MKEIIATAIASLAVICAFAAPTGPRELTTEYMVNPVGIDAARPRLSWKASAGAQTAYEIDATTWKSGKVVSSQSVNVEWNGPKLRTGERINWKVRTWDADGTPSEWSEVASFTMGVTDSSGWGAAKWIGPNRATRADEDMAGAKWITGTPDKDGAVTLSTKFDFDGVKPGEYVEMVHAACPQRQITINGLNCHMFSGQHWDPKRPYFRDITQWLRRGENTIKVKIVKDHTGCFESDERSFIAKIVFPSGRTIVTDDSWQGAKELGALRDTAFGKTLDMRCESLSPAFEREFEVKTGLERATLFITGLGFYEASLNGEKVGKKVLDPAPTDYDDHVLYSAYHLENSLKVGKNALKVLLGHSWYDMRSVATWNFETAPWRDFPRMIARLTLEYADGTREDVVTDDSWRQVVGPVKYDCYMEGEIYDAAKADDPGLMAEVVPAPKGTLKAEAMPGSEVVAEYSPTELRDFGDGTVVVKFPKILSGWVRLTLDSQERGDVVSIRYDERAGEGLTPAYASVRDGIHDAKEYANAAAGLCKRRIDCHYRYTASHRFCTKDAALQTDRWICSGGVETFEPRFTYKGFQYVVIRGLRKPPRAIVAREIRTAFAEVGSFESSDQTLNALMSMADRSYKANYANGYPTDCPHREKNGWTGDASIASELAQYLYENTAAYEKYLVDICDTQIESGDICCVAPTSGWGFKWGNGPAWDSALPVIAWNLYVYRDDRRALDIVYPSLVKYLAYTATKADEYGLVKHGLGDWIPVERSHMPSTCFTSSCYYMQALQIASKIAALKGDADAAKSFALSAALTRDGINSQFYKGDGVYDNGLQTAQAMAVAYGLAAPSEREKVADKLAEAVIKTDCKVDVGLLGTKQLFRALSIIGRTDLAYRTLVNPLKPSMTEWIARGGTALWEDWNNGSSRCHIMFGDFAGWAYQYLAGIRLPETADSTSAVPDVSERAFRKVVFAPQAKGGPDRLAASVNTPYGLYRSSWERKDGKIVYEFTVPAGGSATIRLPGRADEEVGPGVYTR